MKMKWFLLCLIVLCSSVHGRVSAQANLTLSLKDAPLTDVLLFVARSLHTNILLSPHISGSSNLHFVNANPHQAFDLLLQMHGLGKQQHGNVLYIAPYEELLKRQHEQLAWDNNQYTVTPRETVMWQLHYAKAEEIANIISQPAKSFLSARAVLQVDKRTNMILIKDAPQAITKIKKIIKRLDVPVPQIMITARLVSIDKDSEQALGLQFSHSNPTTAQNRMSVRNTGEAFSELGNYSIALTKLGGASLLDIKLAALENAGRAKLISNPRLFTANQQSASIEAGEEVPYQEVSESGGTATSFKRAVLGLQVTPQLLPGNKVLLKLKINQDRPSAKLIQGVPTISTRQISTQVVIRAGQTLTLGGIYEENRERIMQGIPYINHIPVVGWLFKQQQTRVINRELLIFVTPTIIN